MIRVIASEHKAHESISSISTDWSEQEVYVFFNYGI